MSAIEDRIKTSTYEIPHGVHEYTQFSFTDEEAKQIFLQHDHLSRLKNQDNSPIICGKFFEKYYLFGQALVMGQKTLRIVIVTKIPIEFIKSLPDKSFFTIFGRFYEKVADKFIYNDEINDSFMWYVKMNTQKYRDFLEKYQVT